MDLLLYDETLKANQVCVFSTIIITHLIPPPANCAWLVNLGVCGKYCMMMMLMVMVCVRMPPIAYVM